MLYLHGKNNFAEVSKNLARYRFENNVECQNNYVRPAQADC